MKINNHEVKLRPIEPKPVAFDKDGSKEKYVNLKGEQLTKVSLQKAEFKWVNKETEELHDHKASPPAKSFKGNPVGTQEKTQLVEEFDELPYEEVFDYVTSYSKVAKTYQVISESLKEELMGNKKGYIFQYNPGRNYIPYKAIIYYDEHRKVVFMRCLQGNMAEVEWSNDSVETPISVTEKAKPLAITV